MEVHCLAQKQRTLTTISLSHARSKDYTAKSKNLTGILKQSGEYFSSQTCWKRFKRRVIQ